MDSWKPDQYLRFADERTRPAVDLAHRIRIDAPASVVDLGCGPGNSTTVLKARWPKARVTGIDSSPAMIEAARSNYPHCDWLLARIEQWRPERPVDVVFSNAALQWVRDHGPLMGRLMEGVAPGGAFAFQIPSANYATIRKLVHEVAINGPWAASMKGPLAALTMEPPSFYYHHLAPLAQSVDIWETEYMHVMDSHAAIVEWISSTGMRPFLDALDTDQSRQAFVAQLGERVAAAYPRQVDGRILFPFRRTFVIAYA